MSAGLARARARYETTPRKADDEVLVRVARGDRGCLGDLLSGLGAIVLVVMMVLGALNKIAWSWAYLGVALWVGGFFLGTVAQARSGRRRKQALEAGPLVLGTVLRSEEHLRRPSKRVGRAVVLFTLDPQRRFDRELLERLAKHVERQLSEPSGGPERVPLRALLRDEEVHGVHVIPGELLSDEGRELSEPVYLASVFVHPERLEGPYLGAEEDVEAEAAGLPLDAPTRPPTLVLIVDPPRGFVEQLPKVEAGDDAAGEG